MKIRRGPSDTLFPVPAALVVSGGSDEPNILTVAWAGIASSSPPSIAISLKSTRHSVGLIREKGEFTVNLPPARLCAEVDYCGLVSGRKTDKFADTGRTPVAGSRVATPLIEECPYNMECVVTQELCLGDWVLFIAEIVETHVDEDKIDAADGKPDVSKMDPLVYCANIREYWNLGHKLGDGFSVGRSFESTRER